MAIKKTGPLTFTDIVAEFGDTTNPAHSLSEFYAGGANVPAGAVGYPNDVETPIPTTGRISFSNFYGAAKRYLLAMSTRFLSSARTMLTRHVSANGNRKKWTLSFWLKRGNISDQARMMSCGNDRLVCLADGSFEVDFGGSRLTTKRLFRDPSAWYHMLISWDTDSDNDKERFRLFVNGKEETEFSTANRPPKGSESSWNSAADMVIGAGDSSGLEAFDGYISELNFVDGQALPPTSFAEVDKQYDTWVPKKYSGTYGSNGFHLDGTGKDLSSNNNGFTAHNLGDPCNDVPTLTSETKANYAVWNPLVNLGNRNAFSNANLTVSSPGKPDYQSVSTLGMSKGKWYCELIWDSGAANRSINFGITDNPMSTYDYFSGSSDANSWMYSSYDGTKNHGGTATAYGASFTIGDVIGIAFDADTGTLVFYKNNVSQGTAFTGLTSGPYFIAAANGGGAQDGWSANFGQLPFKHTPPAGFKSLNTFNIKEGS